LRVLGTSPLIESSDNKRYKTLYVTFEGSWDITSHRIIKNLCREVAAAAPAPKAAPHHKWMETSISFNASYYPKSMARVRQLPLLVSPSVVNIKKLQIPMSMLQPWPILWGGPGTSYPAQLYFSHGQLQDA
jgi:hypothetical protein